MHLSVTTVTTLMNYCVVQSIVLLNLVLTKAGTILSDILLLLQYPDNSLKPGE